MPVGENANGGLVGGEGGCRKPTMNSTWPTRKAASPGTNRFRGSIRRTSPASEQTRAPTNHQRRSTRSVWPLG